MSKKLIIYLSGGIGNQLFQYFFGMSYSKILKRELHIDHITGFYTDFTFKRNFEIPLSSFEKTKSYKFSFLFFRTIRKLFNIECFKILNNLFITENKLKKDLKILENNSHIEKIFIIGDFQDEEYFKNQKFEIKATLNLDKTKNTKIDNILNNLDFENSVAIGARFYEEMSEKEHHLVGGITPISFYNNSIKIFDRKLKDPKYVIFSLEDNEILKKLNLSEKNSLFINSDTIKCSSLDKLLFMSNFKNFIISNSSFYWWAAYLAEIKFKRINIIATDNYINSKTVPSRWNNLN